MRFLANENFPGDAVAALRNDGHDVAWVRTDAPGASDQQVLARAQLERRILLTFDKDFGELAWRASLPANSGVVLFRIPMPTPALVGEMLAGILGTRQDCVAVVLVGLHVRLDELRRYEPDLVAQLDELARPVMGAGAGFQPDQAGCQVGKELEDLAAFELPA